ncbi:MAG: 30S ribosomal protein S12 methylthiotransferase RimO [Chitinophagales bacterium]|nr:30S ribosomal protein S12 methylthiotransferase RimO [Chitinophagales bacterium]
MRTKSDLKPKVNVITLGCSKNIVDSEVMMAQLRANDFKVSHLSDEALAKSDEKENGNEEVVIINTCGFIDRAKEESVNTILEYAELRKQKQIEKLFVTGCLSERYRDDLQKEIPEVDSWFGTLELPSLLKKLGADYKHELIGEHMLITPAHYAYVKISEGCNRTCAFCAIPLMRGKHVSKPMEQIVTEIKNLVRNGVKEVMLIAQELTYYGLDIYKERKLAELLNRIADIDGLEWIRLHYAYPSNFPPEILDVIRERENICNYLDIPFQHIADPVLKRMRRQITKEETLKLIDTIRKKIPGITLRTTLLVGFPGETEKDFEEMKDFVRETKFDRLGVFTYSHEEGTSGFELNDDVPEEVKQQRASEIMELQQEISSELNQKKIGNRLRVLIDRKEGNHFIGRTEADSPEVDNEVLINAEKNYLRVGDFAEVKIISADEFDLMGEPV